MTPAIHLVLPDVIDALTHNRTPRLNVVTDCCKKSVVVLRNQGDRMTKYPTIANCPKSHVSVPRESR